MEGRGGKWFDSGSWRDPSEDLDGFREREEIANSVNGKRERVDVIMTSGKVFVPSGLHSGEETKSESDVDRRCRRQVNELDSNIA